jgi:beta-phosphoglucomutase
MPLNVQKVKWGHMIRASRGANPFAPLREPPQASTDPDEVFAAWVLGPAATLPKFSARPGLQAVLFDLDGVLVDTAEFHYRSWKRLADELSESSRSATAAIHFDRQTNLAFRGVGRMDCLDKLLGQHGQFFAPEEKQILADRKNAYYLQQVMSLSPRDLAPGARGLAMGLRALSDGGARLAVVSASKNARLVLSLLQISDWFDVIIDGSDVTRSKPDPQCFLLAAERLRVKPSQCVVIEDAEAGVRAAHNAGIPAVALGPSVAAHPAEAHAKSIADITIEQLEALILKNQHPASS